MKKELFKKFSQAVCIAAVGLLVGSSLDYALNGYGVLANPNVFAEGTSATGTTAPANLSIESKTLYCNVFMWTVINGSWAKSNTRASCTVSHCAEWGTGDICWDKTEYPSSCEASYFNEKMIKETTTCSGSGI